MQQLDPTFPFILVSVFYTVVVEAPIPLEVLCGLHIVLFSCFLPASCIHSCLSFSSFFLLLAALRNPIRGLEVLELELVLVLLLHIGQDPTQVACLVKSLRGTVARIDRKLLRGSTRVVMAGSLR